MSRPLATAPRFVIGYHGCSRETAERLAAGDSWLASENRYDWLGAGVYFWEYGPFRAREWAERRFGAEGAVLEARIRLGPCLNLLDTEHVDRMQEAHRRLLADAQRAGESLPRNLPDGRHLLDRLVITTYIQAIEPDAQAFSSVRGCFLEGEPLFPGSRIVPRAHVQIAVRNAACISNLRRLEWA